MPAAKDKKLAITLVRSPIGTPRRQRVVVKNLGLRRMNQTVVRPDTQQVRGMVNKVAHLLSVRPAESK